MSSVSLKYFKGSIDDVRIYNRGLSAEEVKALYDLEKPKAKQTSNNFQTALFFRRFFCASIFLVRINVPDY